MLNLLYLLIGMGRKVLTGPQGDSALTGSLSVSPALSGSLTVSPG